jgi:hypothetical protein
MRLQIGARALPPLCRQTPARGAAFLFQTWIVSASTLFTAAILALAACGPGAAEIQAKQDARLCELARDEAVNADRRADARAAVVVDDVTEARIRASAEAEALARGSGDQVRAARGDLAVAKERLRIYRQIASEERAIATANVARRIGMMPAEIEAAYARTGCLRP